MYFRKRHKKKKSTSFGSVTSKGSKKDKRFGLTQWEFSSLISKIILRDDRKFEILKCYNMHR